MDYFKEVNLAVTICDKEGKILEMNDKSRKTFLKPGQEDLIGKNVLDCHPEPAHSLLADMLQNPRTNVYTIEKKGVKKLIYLPNGRRRISAPSAPRGTQRPLNGSGWILPRNFQRTAAARPWRSWSSPKR